MLLGADGPVELSELLDAERSGEGVGVEGVVVGSEPGAPSGDHSEEGVELCGPGGELGADGIFNPGTHRGQQPRLEERRQSKTRHPTGQGLGSAVDQARSQRRELLRR